MLRVSFIEYVNANKLPQDHPCVLDIIRRQFLNKPPSQDVPLQLDHMEWLNPLTNSYLSRSYNGGQVTAIQRILRNLVICLLPYFEIFRIKKMSVLFFFSKTGGFFVESGAADGEVLSNTLFLVGWKFPIFQIEALSNRRVFESFRSGT